MPIVGETVLVVRMAPGGLAGEPGRDGCSQREGGGIVPGGLEVVEGRNGGGEGGCFDGVVGI